MIIQGTRERLLEKATLLMHKSVKQVLMTKKDAVIAVPGDRNLIPVFSTFCQLGLPWHHVHIFLLDERLVPPDHTQSNYRLLRQYLSEHQPVENLYPFTFEEQNPEQGLADYEKKLAKVGGRFDLVLASSGVDGHIGSLFPNHSSIESKESGFILVDEVPKPPGRRISAGCSLLRQTDIGIILFIGNAKRNALRNFFNIHLSLIECPAKIMTKLNRYYLLTDQEVETP